MTQSAAAAERGVPLTTLNQWVRRGRVPSVSQFGKRLVRLADVMAYDPDANKGGRPATKKGKAKK